jgi:hypothetical protein
MFRYVLEAFFNLAKPIIQAIDRKVKDKMTNLNNALLSPNTTILEAVKAGLQLPTDFTIPALGSNVLYGDLSDSIHIPRGLKVYIPKQANPNYIKFFETLLSINDIKRRGLRVALYDEDLASLQTVA